jgi:L-alanine-DL-glutamate epimerase-like enolase superfamily enzyme
MKKFKIDFDQFYLFSVPTNFDISFIRILFSNHLVVQLKYENKIGLGEGVLYRSTSLKALTLLFKKAESFFEQEFDSWKSARNEFTKSFSSCPGIACAFDMALWDLEGKTEKKPISQLLSNKEINDLPVVEQIFVPKNVRKLRQLLVGVDKRGTSKIKLKTGRNLEKDIENIKTIYRYNKDIQLQLDFNQAMNLDQALWFANKIKDFSIVAWEEPINPSDNFNQLKQLKRKIKIPIILDESVQSINDFKKAIKNRAFDILNLKTSRLGGITSALQFIKLAKKYNINIEIGCSEELGIGIVGQIHLAQKIGKLQAIEALGRERLGFDIVKETIKVRNGELRFNLKKYGLGVTFVLQKLFGASRKLNFVVVSKSKDSLFSFYLQYFSQLLRSKTINGFLLIRHKIKQLLWQKK